MKTRWIGIYFVVWNTCMGLEYMHEFGIHAWVWNLTNYLRLALGLRWYFTIRIEIKVELSSSFFLHLWNVVKVIVIYS